MSLFRGRKVQQLVRFGALTLGIAAVGALGGCYGGYAYTYAPYPCDPPAVVYRAEPCPPPVVVVGPPPPVVVIRGGYYGGHYHHHRWR